MLVEKELTEAVIGAMIEVHKHLGPGLLESAYHQCLCHELALRGLSFEREKPLPVIYKGTKLDCGYRIDLIVEGKLIVDLKAIDALAPIHEAQLLTHMRLANVRVGLLANFNVKVLKDGLMRRVL
jgi:GxxExxY protein